MVGIILSQKMYPILCPPYRHIRTVAHSQPHATVSTKLLFFSSNAENGGFVLDGPPALGAGGPEFKSRRPDQNMSRVFFYLLKAPFTSNPICGNLAGRRSQFASCLVSVSSPHDEFCKNTGGRRAIQKPLTASKLNARHPASMGKIQGTLCISGLINLRK